jgi:serine phosphatase RsbU (regulator of sigma subunit)
MRDAQARRAAIVVGLFAALFAVRFAFESPTFIGVTFVLVLPTVVAALWFGERGGLAVALGAGVAFFAVERLDPSTDASLRTVVLAALVRAGGLAVVGAIVARLFARQVALTRELDELEAVREALRPAVIVPRPALEIAAHYVPAGQGVGGDFFLAAEGPGGSTLLLVGDVVGKGVEAARRAVFVRTSLVTFAPFEDDPARLLRLANAALIDRAGTSADFVTAACVVHRPADATLAWALAGHPPPLWLDDGRPLEGAGEAQPLGLEAELSVSALTAPLSPGGGVLLYTDGVTDARNEQSGRFGEERLQALVAEHGGETASAIVEHLRLALADYAPIAGDDVCLLAARHRAG